MYRLSRVRLRLGIERKQLSFVLLGKVMRDSSGMLISMLLGTNLANYLVTSIVTFLLLSKLETVHGAELLATAMIAPVLFVFSELIPKSIFFYRADSLMASSAAVLLGFQKVFTWCGLVPVLKRISGIFWRFGGTQLPSRKATTTVQRSHIEAIFEETREERLLSPVQTAIINRLEDVWHLTIRSVMTSISKVQIVDVNWDRHALLEKLGKSAFTRLPVYEGSVGNIIGFINIYECLSSAVQFTDLGNFVKPIRKVNADTTVADAINIMQKENQKIVLVTRASHAAQGKPVGIVTMKDLVEELIGELAEW